MARIHSHFITYTTRLIPKSLYNKMEQKRSLYQGIKATQHQISSSSCYLANSPRNTSSYLLTTDLMRCQSIIPNSTSMVNNLPRMHEFLPPTFACIQCENFLLPSLYSTNRQSHSHLKKNPVPNHCDGYSRPHA